MERIRFANIRHGDLLKVIEHRTARRVVLRAERFVHDGIDTFRITDGTQEVRAIIEHIERDPDTDPFGPYEYVEPDDRCQGAEDECEPLFGRARCTQRRSTCQCMCPVCVGDTPDVWGAPVY
ncbi:hypothetical protein [Streptomyces pseudovenezuelae]|uniref:hypothetical protein n=1 Tax=Streptomyces pseudovenezuelae TaxID=67350 RepID=UPI002E81058F|nr:hypothetical protein [Streptomyces pseudovenezuelae]WUA94416.1 hypothetical protein OHO81_45065 [Streptomyces pseudovenezuelae]